MALRNQAKKLKPSHLPGGAKGCLVKHQKIAVHLDDLENPMSTKERQALIKNAHISSNICVPNAIKVAFNRIRVFEKLCASHSLPNLLLMPPITTPSSNASLEISSTN